MRMINKLLLYSKTPNLNKTNFLGKYLDSAKPNVYSYLVVEK